MNIPNVLSIPFDQRGKIEIDLNTRNDIRFKERPLPNIRANRAFYVWVEEKDPKGETLPVVYHVASFEVGTGNEKFRVSLGSRAIATKRPDIVSSGPSWFSYIPLHSFGLQEVSPGVLIAIKAPLN